MSDDDLDALWAARQEELREFSERLSDAAKTLARRIAALAAPTTDAATLHSELDELEFELGDVDAARDFHDVRPASSFFFFSPARGTPRAAQALGGWPPLAALLAPRYADDVRAAAARAVGTAVKNEAEFQESRPAFFFRRFVTSTSIRP